MHANRLCSLPGEAHQLLKNRAAGLLVRSISQERMVWRTLSSSTIQLLYSLSQPSWQPRSLTIWLMDRCFSPVLAARTSQWLVLPTPGVPVIIMLGCLFGIVEECTERGWGGDITYGLLELESPSVNILLALVVFYVFSSSSCFELGLLSLTFHILGLLSFFTDDSAFLIHLNLHDRSSSFVPEEIIGMYQIHIRRLSSLRSPCYCLLVKSFRDCADIVEDKGPSRPWRTPTKASIGLRP